MEPSEQARVVLEEAKRSGMPWERAWLNAMRAFCPPRTCGPQLRAAMEAERELIHELKPYWQAAYEDREVLVGEFEKASSRAEKRLDALMGSPV